MQELLIKISKPFNEKNEKLYKQYIQELIQEAIPQQSNIVNFDISEIFIENKDIEEEVEIIIPKCI